MIWWGNPINKDYAWELTAFHMLRSFSDGITFFEFDINWDKYLDDHTPRFDMMLVIMNFKVFEFNIYYMYHRHDNDGSVLEENPIPDDHLCKLNSTSLTPPPMTLPKQSKHSQLQ